MPKIEIKVCNLNQEKNHNMDKLKKFCWDSLSKKKGTKFQVISSGAIIEANKIKLFQIMRELDKYSIPVRTIKKANM